MKKLPFLLFVLHTIVLFANAQVNVQRLKTENFTNPIGLDVTQPRFSWQLISDKRNVLQNAYEIKLSDEKAALNKSKVLWQTGKISSGQSILIAYQGPSLVAGKRYYWQVRVWDNGNKASAWSAPASFQMGLLQPDDWKASWISPGYQEDSVWAAPLMRKEFASDKKIKEATAYITAHGLYEAQLNGKKIGDACLTPGWTSYNKRLQYQAYDVTDLLKQGTNAIGVTLGDGWYRGAFSFDHSRNHYGKDISLLFQLDITYTDGSTKRIVSDDSWKSATGEIRTNGIYLGETIDARLDKKGWAVAGYNDEKWSGVKVNDFPKNTLVATYNEPVKKHETFKPVKIFTTPKGEQVIDFGQNLVGWVVVNAKGNAGDKITISHAEVLDKACNFYT
jgi:alpha-L-rhamnosidase